MKTIILITVMLFITRISSAQPLIPKNELGLHLYGFEVSSNSTQKPLHLFFNGIQYKYGLKNKYSLRVSIQYAQQLESFDTDDGHNAFWSKGNSELKMFDTRLGLEKTISSSSKWKPFVFADLLYRYESYSEKGLGYGDFPPYNYSINNQSINKILGISAGAGLTWFINSKLFLNIETSIGFSRNLTSSAYTVIVNPIKTISVGVRF